MLNVADLAGVHGPLRGVLVLELCGDEPSGTFGTQILADLGATVVKIERPPGPKQKAVDQHGPISPGLAYTYGLNRNKRSICVDLKSDGGRQAVLALAARADVVYDNYKPGTLERLQLDERVLRALNSELICISVSGFGKTGPRASQPAYDATIQALGGGMSITGVDNPATPPVRWGNPVGGIGGAFYAVIGVLAALRRKRRTGAGASLDISLLDCQLAMHAYRAPPAAQGRNYSAQPGRGGSGALPYGPFRTSEGRWFVLGITGQFWKKATELLDHPEWADDPRFATEKDRQANEPDLNRLVGEAMRLKTGAEWQELFVQSGIPGSRVNTLPEGFEHPHVARRNMLVSFDGDPVGERLKVAGNPMKFSKSPYAGFSPAPSLGADTVKVLHELGGQADEVTRQWIADGHIWQAPEGVMIERPSVV